MSTELHREGDWKLTTSCDDDTPDMSFISHQCPRKGRDSTWFIDGKGPDSFCYQCDEYPPTSIMGLYMLHNYDRLTRWWSG